MKLKLEMLWNEIPRPIRTILNVGISGALVIFFGGIVAAHGSVFEIDWKNLGKLTINAFALGVSTSILRALNPLDKTYGVGKDITNEVVLEEPPAPVVDDFKTPSQDV